MRRELNGESALPVIEPQITKQGIHVWPFDPSFPVDVRFFLLNREHDIPLVRPDHLEVIYIESGEVIYESRERQCLLRKGDIVVVGDTPSHRMSAAERGHRRSWRYDLTSVSQKHRPAPKKSCCPFVSAGADSRRRLQR